MKRNFGDWDEWDEMNLCTLKHQNKQKEWHRVTKLLLSHCISPQRPAVVPGHLSMCVWLEPLPNQNIRF
jgi:hypothetical protein